MSEQVNKITEVDYLWLFYETYAEERAKAEEGQYISPEYIQGRVREKIGDATVITNTKNEEIHESKAFNAYTKHTKELKALFDAGDKDKFAEIVCGERELIDAYYEEKRKQEELNKPTTPGEDPDAPLDPDFSVTPEE